jgi:hypothetical protein
MFIEYNWFSTRDASYLMKLSNHIKKVYFSNIPWYSLSMWVLEQENPLDDICEDENT